MKDIIIVYQMGKVGSTFITKSVRGSKSVHVLYGGPLCPPLRNYSKKRTWTKFYANKVIARIKLMLAKRVKVVCLVREPVARNISMFFQNFPFWYLAHYDNSSYIVAKSHKKNLIENIFMQEFNHEYGINWVDRELSKLIKQDVYKIDFDRECGFSVFNVGKYDVFLARYESINTKSLRGELQRFVNQEINFEKINDGSQKWYSDLYKKFQLEFSPPSEYIDKLYGSKFCKHFYTQKELDAFRKKYIG